MPTRPELQAIEHLDRSARHHLLEHRGRRMRWREFGAGAPLVLLHGGHGSWLHWVGNIEALSARHRLLVPDLPGYGDSDSLPVGSGFAGMVDTVAATAGQLLGPGTAFDLAGFSFGGVVAGCVAQRLHNVRRLALLGAVGHGLRRRQARPMVTWQDAPDEQAMLAKLRHNLGVLMLHGPVDPLALEVHYRSCVRTRFESKKTSLSPALTEALAQLEMPVLAVWGEHDTTGDPLEVGPLWRGAHANRTHAVVPGAGHWVQYEAADAINGLLLDWLSLG